MGTQVVVYHFVCIFDSVMLIGGENHEPVNQSSCTFFGAMDQVLIAHAIHRIGANGLVVSERYFIFSQDHTLGCTKRNGKIVPIITLNTHNT